MTTPNSYITFSDVDCQTEFPMPGGVLYQGGCINVLDSLPSNTFQTCITSPPYWRIKDYEIDNPSVWGRKGNCVCDVTKEGYCQNPDCCSWTGVLGMEPTQSQYISNIATICQSVYRVLRDDGVFWLNLGDTYAKSNIQCGDRLIKKGELSGIPWMVALTLSSNGWYLRKDVIWHKPNATPESVQNRPAKDFEYLFMLTKKHSGYYYNWEALKEPQLPESIKRQLRNSSEDKIRGDILGTRQALYKYHEKAKNVGPDLFRRRRSVWSINTVSLKDAHFATFPNKLAEDCIVSTSREGDRVLDPFMGSGTVAIASAKLNRKWTGVEVSRDYCLMALQRFYREKGIG